MDHNKLIIYTIYDHPKDFPNHYVIKRDFIGTLVERDQNYLFMHRNLDECRKQMTALRLSCVGRSEEDDPVILESWI